jgi:hypothetical protein
MLSKTLEDCRAVLGAKHPYALTNQLVLARLCLETNRLTVTSSLGPATATSSVRLRMPTPGTSGATGASGVSLVDGIFAIFNFF